METSNIELRSQAQELLASSTSFPTHNYEFNTDLLVDNLQILIQYDQILFIDSAVEDYQNLIDNLSQPTEVVVLNSQQDGIFQITNHLSRYDDLSAVHIVSHGDVGQLFLGNTELNQNTLSQYADVLTSWNNFIEEDGDILLYGCEVAADLAGEEFVKDLSILTGADVLASIDKTGSDRLTGDWNLEYAVGNIETELVFNAEIQDSYKHTLVGSDFTSDAFLNDFINDRIIPEPLVTSFNFSLGNPNSSNLSPSDINLDNYSFINPAFNTFLFDFSADSINFDSFNFDFTSISLNSDTITFGFDSTESFNFSSLTNGRPLEFDFYKTETENFNFHSMLSFDASKVTFEPGTVKFEYKPNSLNFDNSLFKSHANLFDYKFLDGQNFSFTDEEISFVEFNASDYRALNYAFDGDELFDTEYYLAQSTTPNGMNPFTDYIENGYKAGLNPNRLFNVNYYFDNNLDVRNAQVDPFKHYFIFGSTENRDPNALFDTSYYNEMNSDVV